MAASGKKAWEARNTRGKLLRRVAGVAILGALAVTVPVIASGNPLMRSQDTTQMASDPEVVYINSVSDPDQRVVNFNDNWKFIMEDLSGAEAEGYNDSSWETINLPHDYSIDQEYTAAGEAESGYKLGGIGWYRKTFDVSEELEGKTVRLDFDGVYMNATVYVNGKNLGTHPYGYSPFSFDITDCLHYGEQNTIAVRVNHQTPSSRWYSGSGIGRDVDLVITDAVHVEKDGVVVTTPNLPTGAQTNLKTTIKNDTESEAQVEVVQTILDANGEKVGNSVTTNETVSANSSETFTATTTPTIATDDYWSVESPTLYTARTEVKVNNEVVDTYDVTFGYRYFDFDADKGFSLNGQALKLKGVCMHHDQGSLGSVNYYDALERQVVMLKEMGCNAIRITHNPAARELIEICNKEGMLLIEEFFDGWTSAKNGNTQDYSRYFNAAVGDSKIMNTEPTMKWAQFDLQEVLRRDINSPAIIMWSLGNEVTEGTGGVSNFADHQKNLIDWTKALDDTRPVTQGDNKWKGGSDTSQNPSGIANAGGESGGVVGTNYTGGTGYDNAHKANPTWKLYGSETASSINSRGVYYQSGSAGNQTNDKLLSSYDDTRVGWGATASSAWYDVITRDFVAGEFVWTGFDYLGEPTPWNGTAAGAQGAWPSPKSSYFGIIDTAGLPKDSYYLYQALWNDDVHTLHMLPAWSDDTTITRKKNNNKIEVVVYTDAPSVRLDLIKPSGERVEGYGATKTFEKVTTTAGFSYQIDPGNRTNTGLYLTWDLDYAEGELVAVPLDESGNDITETYDWQGRTSVRTPGTAAKVTAEVTNNYDRKGLSANGTDLAYITVSILDANGQVVPNAKNNVTFEVSGAGELAGIDNGVQADHQPYRDNNRNAQAGQLVGIVRAGDSEGTINVTVKVAGLDPVELTIPVTADEGESGASKTIKSVTYSQYYYVKTGSELTLPESVTVNYSDGTSDSQTVTWEALTTEQLATPGTYQVSGTVADTKITANVTVLDGVAALLNYSTATQPGAAPVLPSARPAVLADGTVLNASFPVEWEEKDVSDFANANEVVTIKGTATVFGEPMELTATVRVQEEQLTEAGNIASQGKLSQDISEELQSDTLSAVVDGSTDKVASPDQGPNTTCWSNFSSAQEGDRDSAITFEYDTQTRLNKIVIYFGTDSYSGRYPSKVVIETSDSGTDGSWTTVDAEESIGAESAATNGKIKPYTYTFAPTMGTFWRITVTDTNETLSGHNPCTMISEIQLMKVEGAFVTNTTANLGSLTVNGTELTEDELAAESYSTPAIVANITNAVGADNAAVTVLPQDGDAVKIIVESEDHATRKTFTINLGVAKPIDPEDDRNDITAMPTYTTDSELSGYELSKAFDGMTDTFFQSNWKRADPSTDDLWIQMAFDEAQTVSALRYLPRQEAGTVADGAYNGTIDEYVVEWSDDGNAWYEAASGEWPNPSSDKNWRIAQFDEPITAKYFRIRALGTFSASAGDTDMNLSAAEIRLVGVAEGTDISGATVDYPATLNVDRVDAEHPATFSPEEVTVRLDGKTLTYGVDYKLEYTGNTVAGEASFVVVGLAGGETNYSGQTKSKKFTITVKEPTLDAISVKTQPTKVTYTKGDTLDPAGLVLTLSYTDGHTETVAYGDTTKDQFTFSPETLDTAGTQIVNVTYGGKTAQFTVTVSDPAAPTVTGVVVKSGPTKTAYKVGESLDPKGLVLTLTMSDGSTQEAKYDEASADFAFDITQFNAAGKKTVTVTYKGAHTATFTVTVTADDQPEPQPTTHTVTVVLGNGEANLTFQVKDGDKLAEPAAPTRDGYTFAGWFTTVDPATGALSRSYDFSEPVTDDLTIYAGWLPVGGGQQPGQPTTPEQPSGTTGGSGSGAGSASGDALAKTGDPTTVGVALATAVSGAIALAASRRRR